MVSTLGDQKQHNKEMSADFRIFFAEPITILSFISVTEKENLVTYKYNAANTAPPFQEHKKKASKEQEKKS